MFDNLASASSLITDNKVKALAVTTTERSSAFPQVPTMQQEGVNNFDLGNWFGVFTTGGTHKAVVDTLNAAYVKDLQDPAVRKNLLTKGSEAKPKNYEERPEERRE